MDRSEEFAFVWALLDEASAFLDGPTRVQLCVRIGAGEYRETITELLCQFMRTDTPLPPVLSASLWAWTNGFIGSDFETPLRSLVSRIRVSNVIAAAELILQERHSSAPLMSRGCERGNPPTILVGNSAAQHLSSGRPRHR
ncbi:hypothetical protein MN2019_23920 [Mycolicibacterium neoaurum]|uniref:hypothetical protein n=1 Tax=Mycolicibacterium neoaurum TaxID=1795 RepID=UPI001BCCE360|nr:hypothetical protein [Mycolicibacterium neoaurum]QVI27227.1 hypothetical protein MN2019_23920 [Mycolicibacterium neoaurum]